MESNIHIRLQKTIEERNKILPLWEEIYISNKPLKKDIHTELKKSIEELKITKEQLKYFFKDPQDKTYPETTKKAA